MTAFSPKLERPSTESQAVNHPFLFISTDFPPAVGGLQEYSRQIVGGMGGALAEVHLATPDAVPKRLLPQRNTRTYRLVRAKGRVQVLLRLWLPFLRARLSGGIQGQLHMQWSTAVLSYLWNRLGGSSPYVVLIHGAEFSETGRPGLHRWKKRIFSDAAGVVAGSQYTLKLFRELGYASPREIVIPYGNPLEREAADGVKTRVNPLDSTPLRFLCLHRLVARKGTALLFEALAEFKHLPWKLTLVGEGPEKSALQELAQNLGLQERIEFREPVSLEEKLRLFSEASLLLLPSLPRRENDHVEGLGLSLLEAQSLGVPVLAARTGGIPEAVGDGETGWLFTAGDAEDLRRELRKIFSAPEILAAAGAKGPAWVGERFSWPRTIQDLEAFLQKTAQEYFSSPRRKLR